MQPHRRQPTRLHPWDSPGKNTGVGCNFLLQHMKVKSEVAQSCPTLSNPMDCSLPGSSIHGIFQARVLEWVAISFSRGSSQPRDQTRISCVSCIGRQIPYLGSPEEPGKEQRERLKATWIYPCPSNFIYKSSFMLSHLLINNLLMFLNNNKQEFNNSRLQMLEPPTLELEAPWASAKNLELG